MIKENGKNTTTIKMTKSKDGKSTEKNERKRSVTDVNHKNASNDHCDDCRYNQLNICKVTRNDKGIITMEVKPIHVQPVDKSTRKDQQTSTPLIRVEITSKCVETCTKFIGSSHETLSLDTKRSLERIKEYKVNELQTIKSNEKNELIVLKYPSSEERLVNATEPEEWKKPLEIKEILDAETMNYSGSDDCHVKTDGKKYAGNFETQVKQLRNSRSKRSTVDLLFYEDLMYEEDGQKEKKSARSTKLATKRRRRTDRTNLAYTLLCCIVNKEELRRERAEDEHISRIKREERMAATSRPVHRTVATEKASFERDELRQKHHQTRNVKNERNLEKHSQTMNFVSPAKRSGQSESRPRDKRPELSKNDKQRRSKVISVYGKYKKESKNRTARLSDKSFKTINHSESRINEDRSSNQMIVASRSISIKNPSSSENYLKKFNEDKSGEDKAPNEDLEDDVIKEHTKYDLLQEESEEKDIPHNSEVTKQLRQSDKQMENLTDNISKTPISSERSANSNEINHFSSKASFSSTKQSRQSDKQIENLTDSASKTPFSSKRSTNSNEINHFYSKASFSPSKQSDKQMENQTDSVSKISFASKTSTNSNEINHFYSKASISSTKQSRQSDKRIENLTDSASKTPFSSKRSTNSNEINHFSSKASFSSTKQSRQSDKQMENITDSASKTPFSSKRSSATDSNEINDFYSKASFSSTKQSRQSVRKMENLTDSISKTPFSSERSTNSNEINHFSSKASFSSTKQSRQSDKQMEHITDSSSKSPFSLKRSTATDSNEINDFYSKASFTEGGRSITTQTVDDTQTINRYPIHYETWNDPCPNSENENARLTICKNFYGTCRTNPPRRTKTFPWLPENPVPDNASLRNDYQRIPSVQDSGSSTEKAAFPWLQENNATERPQARCRSQRIPTTYLDRTTGPSNGAAFPWLRESPNGNCLSGRSCNLQAIPTSGRVFGEFLQNHWTHNNVHEPMPCLPAACNVAEFNRRLCQCGGVLGGPMIMNCCYCRRNEFDLNQQVIRTNCGYFNK